MAEGREYIPGAHLAWQQLNLSVVIQEYQAKLEAVRTQTSPCEAF
jgi:hypothetical protein